MQDAYVTMSIINVLLLGVAGSGKTCIKNILTDKPPSQQHISTPLKKRPVRVNIRPVSTSKFRSTGRAWEEISQEKILTQAIVNNSTTTRQTRLRVTESVKDKSITSQSDSVPTSLSFSDGLSTATQTVVEKSIIDLTKYVVNEVTKELRPSGEPLSVQDHRQGKFFDSTWVHISDSRGQPQFHDISPLFIRHVSIAAIVFRLTDDFSSFPLNEYNKELMGVTHDTNMTLGETLKSLIQSVGSHCSQKKPNMIFIGTFLDQLNTLTTLTERNEAILDMLPHSMKKQVMYNGSLNHPIFALNTLSRDEDAIATAERIRKTIEACHPLQVKVPVWWHFLDLNLQKLCGGLGRSVLNKNECLMLAQRLGFNDQDLEKALAFFNDVCIAHYYPSILPDTVFVNAQIPLDKVSELIEYAIILRIADTRSSISGKLRRMASEGVITLEILKLDRFKKHYVEGVFSPEDMILLMKNLLVIAHIGESDNPSSQAEFFMPSLLPSFPIAELEKYRVSSDTISSILIHYNSGYILSGVFSCLIVHLIKVAGWKLWILSEKPILAKNCVKFQYPNPPCTITLIDSFSYIEVYMNSTPAIGQLLCPIIREQLMDGIKAARHVLNYADDTPQISIFCPCSVSTNKPHLAEISESGYWICLLTQNVRGELPLHCRVWINNQSTESKGESVLCTIKPFFKLSIKHNLLHT